MGLGDIPEEKGSVIFGRFTIPFDKAAVDAASKDIVPERYVASELADSVKLAKERGLYG